MPEARRADPSWLPAALFALGALLSALAILNGINPHDEGLVLQAAARVGDGELPYRDFYANYGPGQYYLVAGLDLAFGPSLLSWRVVRVALDAGVATLAYALVRRDAPRPLALAVWLAALAAMAQPSLPHPNAAALALGLGALLLARRSPAGAGALAGLAFAFRFDLGAAAIAGAAIAAGGRRAAARAAAAGAGVAAVLVGPFVAAAPGDFWDLTVGFALDEQSLQRLPLPGTWEGGFEPNKILAFYLPYVLMAGLALWLALALVRRVPLRLWAPVPLALAGLAYLLARADEFHVAPLAVVLPILLATLAGRELGAGRAAWGVALTVPLALIALNGLDRSRLELFGPPPLATVDLDVADGVKARPAEALALERLVPYLRARVRPGRPMFVANPRHDLVRVGNPLLYVLLDRPNPTRYDVMQPGVVTTAEVQREIVRDLGRSRPELVVRWLSPLAAQVEPNGAGRSSGVRVLDRYLSQRYIAVARFGDYAVLRLRGTAAGAE